MMSSGSEAPQKIAIVGTGIAGMSAAWLLAQKHDVVVYESDPRLGGHSHTVDVVDRQGRISPVDTGFIVYNELNYPNLTALFAHLGVRTKKAEMDFAVSLDDGALEYGSATPTAIFAQKRNVFSPRFWSMLRDLARFYREAPTDASLKAEARLSIGEYVQSGGYCAAFLEDHLFPQAAAIWSASVGTIREYPAAALVRFFENHGLLKILNRPQWRTVDGGSRAYVEKLTASYADRIRTGCGVRSVRRLADGAVVTDVHGRAERYDQVLMATHADQALALLEDPSREEQQLLGAFRYTRNVAVLHTDVTLMPRRRAAWSSWNYIGQRDDPTGRCVTYWMNRLQTFQSADPVFLTLNPYTAPDPAKVLRTERYDHPMFDASAMAAQKRLWSLQGARHIWFCGAHFGSGFHEDGLQAGLAAAEGMGGVRRPWRVADESGRIILNAPPASPPTVELVA